MRISLIYMRLTLRGPPLNSKAVLIQDSFFLVLIEIYIYIYIKMNYEKSLILNLLIL